MLSMSLLGLRLSLAEAEHEKDFSPETNALPPAKNNESAKLSGQSVFERIFRDTGGKYLYKPKLNHQPWLLTPNWPE
jgi:hypothetical protein